MEGPVVPDGRQWQDRRAASSAFGVVVVPDPVCLVYGGSGDPPCTVHARLAPLVSQGTAVLEASGILEARRWHDRRAAASGWSMAPDPSCLSCSAAFAVSNVQGRGTTRGLRLVALNGERMVDNRGHALAVSPLRSRAVAPHSTASLPWLQSFAASLPSLHASLLHCYHCLPRSYV